MVRKIKNKINYKLRQFSQMGNTAVPTEKLDYRQEFSSLRPYKALVPVVSCVPVDKQEEYSWVGGSFVEGCFIAVPNGGSRFLTEEQGVVSYIGDLQRQPFQWTGGGVYNGCFYGFLRSSNCLLCFNIKNREIKKIDIGLSYRGEHHYGGVITPEGYLYQPPRNSDHILKVNLDTYKTEQIPLCKWIRLKNYRYCGSVLHPNGYIYFLPESGQKVICLDPKTDKISYLNGIVSGMVFDAKVMENGCIYGFSAYGKGILKVDPFKAESTMIHTDTFFGCYGTKLGPNGKLYGIPGDGDDIWEYDLEQDHFISIYKMPNAGIKAKCAGGATNVNGDIYGVPAFGSYLLKIYFDLPDNYIIEKDLYDKFFEDWY